jgi:hypothetical protein
MPVRLSIEDALLAPHLRLSPLAPPPNRSLHPPTSPRPLPPHPQPLPHLRLRPPRHPRQMPGMRPLDPETAPFFLSPRTRARGQVRGPPPSARQLNPNPREHLSIPNVMRTVARSLSSAAWRPRAGAMLLVRPCYSPAAQPPLPAAVARSTRHVPRATISTVDACRQMLPDVTTEPIPRPTPPSIPAPLPRYVLILTIRTALALFRAKRATKPPAFPIFPSRASFCSAM